MFRRLCLIAIMGTSVYFPAMVLASAGHSHYAPPPRHHEPPPHDHVLPPHDHVLPPHHTNPPVGHGGGHPPVTGGTHPPYRGIHPGHAPQNPYRGTYVPPADCERHDGYYRGKRYFPGPYCARRDWRPTLWFFLLDSNVWSCPELDLIQTDRPDLAGAPFTVIAPEQTYEQLDDGMRIHPLFRKAKRGTTPLPGTFSTSRLGTMIGTGSS